MFIWDFILGDVIDQMIDGVAGVGSSGIFGGIGMITSPIMALFIIILMGYAVIKVFFPT